MDKLTKTLIIDCQVFQTAAWTRGMGRYLVSLIMGIYQNPDYPEVILVFNKNFSLTSDCSASLGKVAPKAKRVFLDFDKGLSDQIAKHNEGILDNYITEEHLEDSVYLNGSIFSFDYAPIFPSKTLNTCIFYDMIPLKRWSAFYKFFPDEEYFKRFKHLYACDMVFAISEGVRQELVQLFGFDDASAVNIRGAEIPHFLEHAAKSQNLHPAKKSFRYILLPGGNSPHKNMLRAIGAFDEFNATFGDTFKLVITSFYSDDNIKIMQSISPNIELTGNVSDDELHLLYKGSEVVMFPSLDEGLGLPVLEAVGYGLKVACSSIAVFKEISNKAFYLFDPESPADMSRALMDAVINKDWEKKRVEYAAIKKKFTWQNSARSLLDGLERGTPTSVPRHVQSIIIEQAGDIETLRKISAILRMGNIETTTLFIDTLAELKKKPNDLPVIFKYFLHTYDISDAPRKAKGDVYVPLTRKSMYSIPIGIALDASFPSSSKDAKEASKRLIGSFGDEFMPEGVVNALTVIAQERLI